MAIATRDFSVYPVRLRGSDGTQYLRVRADEGAIGVGRRVSVWLQNEWQRARVVEAWADGQHAVAGYRSVIHRLSIIAWLTAATIFLMYERSLFSRAFASPEALPILTT